MELHRYEFHDIPTRVEDDSFSRIYKWFLSYHSIYVERYFPNIEHLESNIDLKVRIIETLI